MDYFIMVIQYDERVSNSMDSAIVCRADGRYYYFRNRNSLQNTKYNLVYRSNRQLYKRNNGFG